MLIQGNHEIWMEVNLKILITFYNYGENVFGGIEKSLFNFIQGLIITGNDVVVYTSKMYKKSNYKSFKGFDVRYSNYLLDKLPVVGIDDAIKSNYLEYEENIRAEIVEALNEYKPDYVLSVDHIAGILSYIDIPELVDYRVGLVFHMLHNEQFIKKAFDYGFDDYFAISNYVRDGLSAYNYNNKAISLLPNSIDKTFIDTRITGSQDCKVFCNARMAKGKGVENLVTAFLEVEKVFPEAKLFVCGGDFHFVEKTDCIEYINRCNDSFDSKKIFVLDNIHWDDIKDVIAEMKLMVLPTEMETFGLAALETIAVGIPLLTNKVGNLPGLLEDSAYYLDSNDAKDVAKCIIDILSNYNLTITKVEVGKKIAGKYTSDVIANEFLERIRN